MIGACSDHVSYRPGLVTRQIEGTILLAGAPAQSKPFLIVRKYQNTLIETSDGYLETVTAELVHPDPSGQFIIEYDSGTRRVEYMVVAEGFNTSQGSFKRSLGVSAYQVEAVLTSQVNWRENYYLTLKPVITEYIVEERYELSEVDRQFLSDWLDMSEDNLAKQR